jgi:hypothetical protein
VVCEFGPHLGRHASDVNAVAGPMAETNTTTRQCALCGLFDHFTHRADREPEPQLGTYYLRLGQLFACEKHTDRSKHHEEKESTCK